MSEKFKVIQIDEAKTILEDVLALLRIPLSHTGVLHESLMTAGRDQDGNLRLFVNEDFKKDLATATGLSSVTLVEDALSSFVQGDLMARPVDGLYLFNDELFGDIDWRDTAGIEVSISRTAAGGRRIQLTQCGEPSVVSENITEETPSEKEEDLPYRKKKVAKKRVVKTATDDGIDDTKDVAEKSTKKKAMTTTSDASEVVVVEISQSIASTEVKPLDIVAPEQEKMFPPAPDGLPQYQDGALAQVMNGEPPSEQDDEADCPPPAEIPEDFIDENPLSDEELIALDPEVVESTASETLAHCPPDVTPFWLDQYGNFVPEYGDPAIPTEQCSPEVQAFRAKVLSINIKAKYGKTLTLPF